MTVRKISLLFAVFALLVAACGGGDDSSSSSTTTTAAPAATTTTAMAETTTTAMAETTTTAMAEPTIGTADNPIEVLYVPSVSADEITSGGELLAKALNDATGLTFDVKVGSSYAATIEEMCASPDKSIGFIPAQGYVLASDLCNVNIRLKAQRFGFDVYWTEYIVPRDSGYTSIFDLAGKKWAYPDPASTSGYLIPSGQFAKSGIKVGDSFEAGGHTEAVRAVYNGEADFGTVYYSPPVTTEGEVAWDGTKENADINPDDVDSCAVNADGAIECNGVLPKDARANLASEAPDVIQKVAILTLSDEIPNDGMAFGPDFPSDLEDQIVQAMQDFATNDPEGFAAAFAAYSWNGVSTTSDSEFDSIRALLNALGFSLEDF
ncbi:MAG: phosphate/phosphite/phosphonate ABC transporter substrate-binding protein [Acidimicrobiia bacterium]